MRDTTLHMFGHSGCAQLTEKSSLLFVVGRYKQSAPPILYVSNKGPDQTKNTQAAGPLFCILKVKTQISLRLIWAFTVRILNNGPLICCVSVVFQITIYLNTFTLSFLSFFNQSLSQTSCASSNSFSRQQTRTACREIQIDIKSLNTLVRYTAPYIGTGAWPVDLPRNLWNVSKVKIWVKKKKKKRDFFFFFILVYM